jgi:hypothetical protein
MRPAEDAIESRLETLLLRAIDSYESRHGTDPTVLELAADLGIPPDFGHSQLGGRLGHEVSAGFVSHYRGRFSLTAAGREVVEGDISPPPAAVAARARRAHRERSVTQPDVHINHGRPCALPPGSGSVRPGVETFAI